MGVCLVFAGWAASGLVVQVVGALELFGPTVPALLKTLRLIPGVGHVLALPPVAALLDALSVVSGGLSPNATYAMFALALAAGVPRLLGAGGGVGSARRRGPARRLRRGPRARRRRGVGGALKRRRPMRMAACLRRQRPTPYRYTALTRFYDVYYNVNAIE